MPPRDSGFVAAPQDMNVSQTLPPHYSTHTPTPALPPVTSRIPPCSTLFVGNLPKHVPEIELQRMFRSVPGFMRMKASMKNGLPILFLEFCDENASTYAMQLFQTPPWNDMRLRVDYAKAKMGESKRREREGDTGEERASKRQNTNGNDQNSAVGSHDAEESVV